jgi:alkanesulfonate monooxygenase SsuD/methylene tetrahydromethanopterin reductase-like flavin-dependent oxidoreductase (luciferase family)
VEQRGSPLHQLYAERLAYLDRLDEAGFWAYFKSEHHLTPLDAAPCPSVLLAAAAPRTRRIRLVPLVYLLPFHHPLRQVEEIAMLDHLSGGRLEVGVGRGIAPPEHEMWGLDPALARDRSEETLEVLLQAMQTDRLTFRGRFWSFDDVPVELHPLQQPYPALWYPGNVEVAGRRGFNTVVGGPIRAIAAQAARYRELFAEHRQDAARLNPQVDEPIVAGAIRVYVAPTDAEAIERARRAWAAYTHNITLLWRQAGIAPSEMPADPSVGGDFERAMALDIAVVGSPERVRDHVERHAAETGTDHLVASFSWGDLDHHETMASLDRFVEAVVEPLGPRVHAVGAAARTGLTG